MKKKNSKKTASSGKRRAQPKSVEEYMAGVAEPARERLSHLRAAIRSVVPAAATETISYGIPAFRHNGILVWYAAFSDHCSLFPTAAVIAAFEKELAGFTVAKGTVQFPRNKPLPVALIKKMVKARVAQAEAKKRP